eukprot:2523048-Amphidinium_carterae.1
MDGQLTETLRIGNDLISEKVKIRELEAFGELAKVVPYFPFWPFESEPAQLSMARVDEIAESSTPLALLRSYSDLFYTCNSDPVRWQLIESSPELFDGSRAAALECPLAPSREKWLSSLSGKRNVGQAIKDRNLLYHALGMHSIHEYRPGPLDRNAFADLEEVYAFGPPRAYSGAGHYRRPKSRGGPLWIDEHALCLLQTHLIEDSMLTEDVAPSSDDVRAWMSLNVPLFRKPKSFTDKVSETVAGEFRKGSIATFAELFKFFTSTRSSPSELDELDFHFGSRQYSLRKTEAMVTVRTTSEAGDSTQMLWSSAWLERVTRANFGSRLLHSTVRIQRLFMREDSLGTRANIHPEAASGLDTCTDWT